MALFFTQVSIAQTEWSKIFEKDGVTISSKEMVCKVEIGHTQLRYLIMVENTTSQTKTIEWDLELKDQNGVCFTCNGSKEHHKIVKIAPGEILDGSISKQQDLYVVMKFLDIKVARELSEVKLENFKVTDFN